LNASKAVDDYTVEIVLTEPNVSQWYQLADVRMFCKASMDASPDGMKNTPVGTGPYKVTKYISGSSISMEARDDYWGEKPAIKYVNWMFIAESSQRALALESGNIDLIRQTATNDFLRFQKDSKYGTFVRNTFKTDAVYFNCSENSICKDARVRKAIAYAIDANAINKVVYSGLLSTCVFTASSSCSGADVNWNSDYFGYNLDKAKQLIQEAGIPQGTEIKLGFNTGLAGHSNICEIIQSQLAEIGLKVTIVSYDAATWDSVRTDPTIFDMHINYTSSPEGYYGNSLASAIVLSNSVFYKNEKFDELLKISLGTTDPEKQLSTNKALNDIMMEDCPVYALINTAWLYSYTSSLKGVEAMGAKWQRISPAMLSFA